MSQTTNEVRPSPELVTRVYEYVKAQQPCQVRDVIQAMRQFFPENIPRDEIKPLVVRALAILTNEQRKVFIGVDVLSDTELSSVYVIF